MSTKAQCWAHDSGTQLRCTRPGGHSGDHRATVEFSDSDVAVMVPVLDPRGTMTVTQGHTTATLGNAEVTLSVVPGLEEQAAEPIEAPEVRKCVACQHSDVHRDPDTSDKPGCSHPDCACLTAVWG